MPIRQAQIDEMKGLLRTNRKAVEKALIVLFKRQTEDEQVSETTQVHNQMGFTAYDAELLSSFAKQVIRNKYNRGMGCRLTERQFEIARKRVEKYAKQLCVVAEEKAATERRAVVDAEFGNEAYIRRQIDGLSNYEEACEADQVAAQADVFAGLPDGDSDV
jgi:hypothetical protein